MSHIRTGIRHAIAARVTGLATTGNRVASGRGKPLDAAKLPALRVRFLGEAIDRGAMGGRLDRAGDVGVTAYAAGADFDDVLDLIAAEIETAMAPDGLHAGVLDHRLVRTEHDEYAAGDRPAGSITLVYRVRYSTRADAPGEAA